MLDTAALRRFGVVPLEQARTMSGLDLLRRMRQGDLPAPPICRLLGFDLVEVDYGHTVFESTPTEDHHNVMGYAHGGYVATLLDSCMACAVHSAVPAGQGYTTIEVKVNFTRPVRDRASPVRAEGTVINVGSRIATAEGRLTDSAGTLLAHGTTTCLIFAI